MGCRAGLVMGTIIHNAIIITGIDDDLDSVRELAIDIFDYPIPELAYGKANGYVSLFIPPDGSKEGWETSNQFNEMREGFIKGVKTLNKFVDIIEIAYGECEARIVEDNY